MKKIRIIFMGTPEFSVPILQGLIDNYDVIAVVTQPDKVVGRNKEISYNPIKSLALKYNIKVIQPVKIRDDYKEIVELNSDMIVTCAYGQIIPEAILDNPKLGCINVHASLLPKLRGGAPIHHAIIDGYEKTGITIMYMDKGMDSGDIIEQSVINIDNTDNVGVLHDKLSLLGEKLLLDTIPNIIEGNINRIKQDTSLVTIAPTIKKEDELIKFNDSAKNVFNKIRGLNPFPGGYIIVNNNAIKIYESRIGENVDIKSSIITNLYKDGIGISCNDKEIIITKIKPNGKNMMTVKDYLNGIKNKEELIGCVVNEKKY